MSTNKTLQGNTNGRAIVTGTEDINIKDKLGVNSEGYLSKAAVSEDYEGPVFQVAKIYTMPDGQDAVKLQRIA